MVCSKRLSYLITSYPSVNSYHLLNALHVLKIELLTAAKKTSRNL